MNGYDLLERSAVAGKLKAASWVWWQRRCSSCTKIIVVDKGPVVGLFLDSAYKFNSLQKIESRNRWTSARGERTLYCERVISLLVVVAAVFGGKTINHSDKNVD